MTAFKAQKHTFIYSLLSLILVSTTVYSQVDDDDDILFLIAGPLASLLSDNDGDDNDEDEPNDNDISSIYDAFGDNVNVVIDGDEVVFEATGKPDHTSTYWNPDGSSGLYVDADTSITTVARMSPGFIDNYSNTYSLRVDIDPSKASNSSATSLGAVGIAVSGAPIFNDNEGGNQPINFGVISGFDRNGAHTGPETYHYHLEPRAISYDDDALIGVIADGFFLYGRKCDSTDSYPSNLDDSGGHTSSTQYTDGASVYHYHIQDSLYEPDWSANDYYLLFPGDYQGTPSNIN